MPLQVLKKHGWFMYWRIEMDTLDEVLHNMEAGRYRDDNAPDVSWFI
jgi:hypothetical protein